MAVQVGEDVREMSSVLRQFAALICAGTLVWDYYRDPSVVSTLSIWALLLHFVYFQLPLRSRAIAYLHPPSFLGAAIIPMMYIYLLLWKPGLEVNHMEVWDENWTTIVVRAFLVHCSPLLLHTLEVTSNQVHLITAYRSKSKLPQMLWAFISFPLVGFIFELTFPDTEENEELRGISREDFIFKSKVIGLCSLIFSYSVLYLLIMRRAYGYHQHDHQKHHHHHHSH